MDSTERREDLAYITAVEETRSWTPGLRPRRHPTSVDMVVNETGNQRQGSCGHAGSTKPHRLGFRVATHAVGASVVVAEQVGGQGRRSHAGSGRRPAASSKQNQCGLGARLGMQGGVEVERDDGEFRGGGATAGGGVRRGRRWPEPTPISARVSGWG
jgi:hypothetical protein